MATKPEVGRKPIRFKVGYDGKPDKPINAALYAFDARGRLLASAPLREGEAALDAGARPTEARPLVRRARTARGTHRAAHAANDGAPQRV